MTEVSLISYSNTRSRWKFNDQNVPDDCLSAFQMIKNNLKQPFKGKFLSVLLVLFRWPGVLHLFPLWVNRESADEATGPDSASRWSRMINRLWFTGTGEQRPTAVNPSASQNCPSQDNQPNLLVEGEMLKWMFQRSCHSHDYNPKSGPYIPSHTTFLGRKSRTNSSLFSKFLLDISPYCIIIALELLHKCCFRLKRHGSSEANQTKKIR